MLTEMKPIKFTASIPPSNGAIVIHGTDGARITFDVPESSMGSVLQLTALRKTPLVITVRLFEDDENFRFPVETRPT